MSNPQPSFSTQRRWSIAFHTAVSVVAMLAVLVMVNYFGSRYYSRFIWRSDNPNALSAQTLSLLRSLTNEVQAIVFFQRDSIEFHSAVSSLLEEYQLACPKLKDGPSLKVEYVDYMRTPTRAISVLQEYKLDLQGNDSIRDMVLFVCGKRVKAVSEKDLYELDYQNLMAGKTREVKRTSFQGELKFTEAINNVVDQRHLKAYFVTGHDEHSFNDTGNKMAYSQFLALTRLQNIDIDADSGLLLSQQDVPEDCNLLIIAGPQKPFLDIELKRLHTYLTRGGRLFVLWNNFSVFPEQKDIRLDQLLSVWGVAIGRNMVVALNDKQEADLQTPLVCTNFPASSHPIVRPLLRSQLQFVLPCTVEKRPMRQDADAPKVEVLIMTDTNTIAKRKPDGGQPDLYLDPRGPLSIAVAVEKGSVPGVAADRGATRIVVVGDSFCLANMMAETYNRDFAAQAINWLVDTPRMMGGIVPRPVKEYRVVMSQKQLLSATWILLAGIPGAVLCLGFVVWMRRRN